MKERIERSTADLTDRIEDAESALNEAMKQSEQRTRRIQNVTLWLVLFGAAASVLTLARLLIG